MSIATRMCLFALIAVACAIAWHWNTSCDPAHEATQLALAQFQNDDAVSANLQQTTLAHNWWPLVWPALVVLLGAVMFWDDVERLWQRDETE